MRIGVKTIGVIGTHKFPNSKIAEAYKQMVKLYVQRLPGHITVVSGGAPGVDTWGEEAARERHKRGTMAEPIVHRADWGNLSHPEARIKTRKDGSKYDAAAGPRRDRKIVEDSDVVVAFRYGPSPGTNVTLRICDEPQLQVPKACLSLIENTDEWVLDTADEDPALFFIIPPGQ